MKYLGTKVDLESKEIIVSWYFELESSESENAMPRGGGRGGHIENRAYKSISETIKANYGHGRSVLNNILDEIKISLSADNRSKVDNKVRILIEELDFAKAERDEAERVVSAEIDAKRLAAAKQYAATRVTMRADHSRTRKIAKKIAGNKEKIL